MSADQPAYADALHRATPEASLDCVITIDHRGLVLEFNPAAERTFGYSGAEAPSAPSATPAPRRWDGRWPT